MSTNQTNKPDPDFEKFSKIFRNLPFWKKKTILLKILWYVLLVRIRDIPIDWLFFVMQLDRDMEKFGMPHRLWLWLEKWFNHRPWPESEPLVIGGTKFWIGRFEDEEDLEIRITRYGGWIADIWVEKKGRDWILYGVSVYVENYRDIGLGKYLLAQAVTSAKAVGSRSLCETIEKDCEWPKQKEEFSKLLVWYKNQGFVLTEDETNYILTLFLEGSNRKGNNLHA